MNQSNPFQKGDVVYHPKYGQVKVAALFDEGCACEVRIHDNLYTLFLEDECLSYEPWPQPVHVKPT